MARLWLVCLLAAVAAEEGIPVRLVPEHQVRAQLSTTL